MSNCRKLLIDKIIETAINLNKIVEEEQKKVDNISRNFQFSKKADKLNVQTDELINILESLEQLCLKKGRLFR